MKGPVIRRILSAYLRTRYLNGNSLPLRKKASRLASLFCAVKGEAKSEAEHRRSYLNLGPSLALSSQLAFRCGDHNGIEKNSEEKQSLIYVAVHYSPLLVRTSDARAGSRAALKSTLKLDLRRCNITALLGIDQGDPNLITYFLDQLNRSGLV